MSFKGSEESPIYSVQRIDTKEQQKHNYQTPPWVCDLMVDMLPEEGIETVLEPTPGQGHIVTALLLKNPSYKITAPKDFWQLSVDFNSKNMVHFDAAVMNPPFTPMRRGYKIFFRVLEISDYVIALMPWFTIINSTARTRSLILYGLKSVINLPRNTFPNTRIQCCILEMKRGHKGGTAFKFI